MSEAIWNLIVLARDASNLLFIEGYKKAPEMIDEAIAAVESELSKSPQQMHDEHLQEVLKWNR